MLDLLSYRQWAISQQFADNVGIVAFRLLNEGHGIQHLVQKKTQEEISARYALLPLAADSLVVSTEWDRELCIDVATTRYGQRVAIIPIQGTLTKRGDLCSYGMRDYIGMIERANKSEKVAAIVLDMESPGGTVDGTSELGLAVKQSKKPVVAFGDGMVASAAYWVASQAREIIANKNNPTEFGSIGVLYMHYNAQAYIQKEIGSIEIIRAPQSQDKARINMIEPITDEQRAEIKEELKATAKEFFSTVKKGRGARLNTGEENIFTGKMYKHQDALALGMIDALGTLQSAVDRAGFIALTPLRSTSAPTGAQVNTNMKIFKSNLLSKIFGKAEKAEEEKTAAEPMDQVDEHLLALEAENAQLKEQHAALTAKVTEQEQKAAALEQTVAEQKTQITTLEGEKKELQTKLEAKPTSQTTTVISKEEQEENVSADAGASATKKNFRTSADDEADKYLEATKFQIK